MSDSTKANLFLCRFWGLTVGAIKTAAFFSFIFLLNLAYLAPAGASVCFLPDGENCDMSTDYTGNPCSSVCKYTPTEATSMQSNGYNCQKCGNGCDKYKCEKISCPADYSTDKTNVRQCGTSGSNGWELVTSGKSGGKDCTKCNKKTCASGVDETNSLCGSGKDYVPSSTYSGDKRCCVKDTCPTPYKKSCGSDQSKEQKGQTDAGTPCYLCTDITTSCEDEGKTWVTVKKIKSISIDKNNKVTVVSEDGGKKCLKCDNSDAHQAYELVGENNDGIVKVTLEDTSGKKTTDDITSLPDCEGVGFTNRGTPVAECKDKKFYGACYMTELCYVVTEGANKTIKPPANWNTYAEYIDGYGNPNFSTDGSNEVTKIDLAFSNYSSCEARKANYDTSSYYTVARRCNRNDGEPVVWKTFCSTGGLYYKVYDCFGQPNPFRSMRECPKTGAVGDVANDCVNGDGKMCGDKVFCKQCNETCYVYPSGGSTQGPTIPTDKTVTKITQSGTSFGCEAYEEDYFTTMYHSFGDKCQKSNGTKVKWKAQCLAALGDYSLDCLGNKNPFEGMTTCPKTTGSPADDCVNGVGKMCGDILFCKQCKETCYGLNEGRSRSMQGPATGTVGADITQIEASFTSYRCLASTNSFGYIVKNKCKKNSGEIVYWSVDCANILTRPNDCFGQPNPFYKRQSCPSGTYPRKGADVLRCENNFYVYDSGNNCVSDCLYTQTEADCSAGKKFVKVCKNQDGIYTGYCE